MKIIFNQILFSFCIIIIPRDNGTETMIIYMNALRSQLNWYQYRLLIQIDNEDKREYYELEAANNGWTGRELERQINSGLYERLLLGNDKKVVLEVARKQWMPYGKTTIDRIKTGDKRVRIKNLNKHNCAGDNVMKNYLFYAVLALIVLGCGTQNRVYNSKIYEGISVCQGSQEIIGKSLNFYRVQLDYLNKFEYSPQNDTVYILEMYGIQGNGLVTIWNKNKTLSYTNEQGNFESKNEPLFTEYMMKLVSEWNIPEIRKEEETNSNILPNELIYATKIVFKKGKYQIDCIHFKDFFNIYRDFSD